MKMVSQPLSMLHFKFSKILAISSFVVLSTLVTQEPSLGQSNLNEPAVLIERGYLLLNEGKPSQAFDRWSKAQKLYIKRGDRLGASKALIAQSKAYKALGQQYNACSKLLEALEIELPNACKANGYSVQINNDELSQQLQRIPKSSLAMEALIHLGSSFQQLGKLGSAEMAHLKADELSSNHSLFLNQTNQLGLANTYRSSYQSLQGRYSLNTDEALEGELLDKAVAVAQKAFKGYEDLSSSNDPQIALRARLNWLKLYQAMTQFVATAKWEPLPVKHLLRAKTNETSMTAALHKANFDDLPKIESIFARLSFAKYLLALHEEGATLRPVFELSKTALMEANALENTRAQSFALGMIGQLYQRTNQTSQAQAAFSRATGLSRSVQAWDSAYQWQRYLGQLHQQQGDQAAAISHYQDSLRSLESVREDLLPINADLQFSFAVEVAPVYEELVALLLSGETTEQQLSLATETYQQFQAAELENYLRCGRIETISIAEVTDAPPTLHVLRVGGRYEVILRTQSGTYIRHQPDSAVVQSSLTDMQLYLEVPALDAIDEEDVILPHTQALYDQLIRPIAQHLPEKGTLNFVLDHSLQNLPMGMLHDGSGYLVESYGTSTILNGQLQLPKQSNPENIYAVIAGLSEFGPSLYALEDQTLNSLPEVVEEVRNIQAAAKKNFKLLNRSFTRDRLRKALQQEYPILHIASHGQFSSEPEQTYFLAWNRKVTANDLRQMLLERADYAKNPLELLVLSACQTAKGDPRSALGIAGMATQAGARSTLASLWRVESKSTTLLMSKFYANLEQGLPKAEALRQAQLSLMQTKYRHPYFWASFVLTGSWL